MDSYIYQLLSWPDFTWDAAELTPILTAVRHQQGRVLGRMEGLGFNLREEANLLTLTADVLKSSEIEGEILNRELVKSSIARWMGIDVAGVSGADRNVDGVVEMMLDATQHYTDALTEERLFRWHSSMFPMGRSGMQKITVGRYRENPKENPMQVVSGAMGRPKVHFQAPDSITLKPEMDRFLQWFNTDYAMDPVLKAAVAHLWFVTIHPFDDGNGRITRAITDMQLSRADNSAQRFYSMSSQISIERKGYYEILEQTQKSSLDISRWLKWFLQCLDNALINTEGTLARVIKKSRFWEKCSSFSLNQRQKLLLNKLLEGFEGKLTSSKWAKIAKTSQDTAGRDINSLIEKSILIKEEGGGRSTSYILNDQFI